MVQDVIYKFMPKRFRCSFLDGTSIRVGTLFDFRKQEHHGGGKVDPLEGIIGVNAGPTGKVTEDMSYDLKAGLMNSGVDISGLSFRNNNVDVAFSSEDYFVFCASLELQQAVAEGLDPDYDCCIAIRGLREFGQKVSRGLMDRYPNIEQVRNVGGLVEYEERLFSPSNFAGMASPFLKETRFAYQKEYRICFAVGAGDLAPTNIAIDPEGCGFKPVWER